MPDIAVAVLMKNSAAFIEIALATGYLGAVLLPINYRPAAPEDWFFLGYASGTIDRPKGVMPSYAK